MESLIGKLNNISLVVSLRNLTDQLMQSVTSAQCQQWLSDRLTDVCNRQTKLVDLVTLSAANWHSASQHLEMYERGCRNAQHCILGNELFYVCVTGGYIFDDITIMMTVL